MLVRQKGVHLGRVSWPVANEARVQWARRWRIPRPEIIRRTKGAPPPSSILKNLHDASHVQCLYLGGWLKAKGLLPEGEAGRAGFALNLDTTIDAVTNWRNRQMTENGIRREEYIQLRHGEGASAKNARGIGSRFMKQHTPFETVTELDTWFRDFEAGIRQAKGDNRTEDECRAGYLHNLDVIEIARGQAARIDALMRVPEKKDQIALPPRYLTATGEIPDAQKLELAGVLTEVTLTTPSLLDCFSLALAAWIDPSDLWGFYLFYSPVLALGALLGRLLTGCPIAIEAQELDVLMHMLGVAERFREQPVCGTYAAFDTLKGIPPPRSIGELEEHHKKIVKDIELILELMLDREEMDKAVRAYAAQESDVVLTPRTVTDESTPPWLPGWIQNRREQLGYEPVFRL